MEIQGKEYFVYLHFDFKYNEINIRNFILKNNRIPKSPYIC